MVLAFIGCRYTARFLYVEGGVMSRFEAQLDVNEWLAAYQRCMRLGHVHTAAVCLDRAKRICAEFKVKVVL